MQARPRVAPPNNGSSDAAVRDPAATIPDTGILDGLNDRQRAAVTHPSPTLVVHAGAGSGKTRVLTRRIAHQAQTGRVDPRHVLALTFTRKAAGELAARLRSLGLRDSVAAGTFHAVAYAQLRGRWADRGIEPPTLLDRKVGFIARVIGSVTKASPVELASEIEWAKARMVLPAQYSATADAEGRRPPIDAGQMADVFARYENEKQRRRLVDFDDLLRLCAKNLSDDREFAAALHWRFRHVFVDEFQDVNPQQFALLRAWVGDRDNVCIVGDPNQAIYGWNGADARFLTDFGDYFPEAKTVVLDQNYRSTPQILRAADSILAEAGERSALRPNRPDGNEVHVGSYPTDRAEAAGVARAVRDMHRPGSSWGSQAILLRTKAQAALLEDALRKVGIPFRVRGAQPLCDDPDVKRATNDLGRSPLPFDAAIADFEAELQNDTTGVEQSELSDRQATLQTLVRMARDYLALDHRPSALGFVAWLRDTTGGAESDPTGDAVDISTFHAAKGLEWPTVHLVGLEDGLVPIGHAKTPEAKAEERRLIYVAMTRAEQDLRCTWAEERTFGSRTINRRRSPYLAVLDGDQPPGDKATATSQNGIGAARASLRSVPSKGRRGTEATLDEAGQQTFAILKDWRSREAQKAGVPAFVVFHDKTLVAIAAAHPETTEDLLQISGIGPVKAQRYGSALLAAVGAVPTN